MRERGKIGMLVRGIEAGAVLTAAVGLLESWGIIQPAWVQYIAITVVSTVLVMVVAGRVTQAVMKRGEKKHE